MKTTAPEVARWGFFHRGCTGVHVSEIKYHLPMFERLQPRTDWRGGRMTHTDVLSLADAARFASRHTEKEVTPDDFLRAAARGEITLLAIVHHTAQVCRYDGGVYCNAGEASENIVPAGCIPTLPLTACQQLAAAGRARWRTFDGFTQIDGTWWRYTEGKLLDAEPDFETSPSDCRVTGYYVHALADAFMPPTPTDRAPVENVAPVQPFTGTAKVWTEERKAEARAYRDRHGLKKTAEHYKVSETTISKHIPAGKAKAKKATPFGGLGGT